MYIQEFLEEMYMGIGGSKKGDEVVPIKFVALEIRPVPWLWVVLGLQLPCSGHL